MIPVFSLPRALPAGAAGIADRPRASRAHNVTLKSVATFAVLAALTSLTAANRAFAVSPFTTIDGFSSGADFTSNGVAAISGDVLTITKDGVSGAANSVFYDTPQSVEGFTASFTYRATFKAGTPPGDGMTFVVQNDPAGVHALGFTGSDLGYSNEQDPGGPKVGDSVAVAFNVNGEHTVGTNLLENGQNAGFAYISTGDVDLGGGHPIEVTIKYAAGSLTETLTDSVTKGTWSNSYSVDIPTIVGSDTAFVGFTGGTGDYSSTQKISDFAYTPTTKVLGFTISPNHIPGVGPPVAFDVATEGPIASVTVEGDAADFNGTPPSFSLTQSGDDWIESGYSAFMFDSIKHMATLTATATTTNGQVLHANATLTCSKLYWIVVVQSGISTSGFTIGGPPVQFTDTLYNPSPNDITEVAYSINLPADFICTSPGDFSQGYDRLTWQGFLQPHQQVSLTYTLQMNRNTTPGTIERWSVYASGASLLLPFSAQYELVAEP
jgi:hypothetical protein